MNAAITEAADRYLDAAEENARAWRCLLAFISSRETRLTPVTPEEDDEARWIEKYGAHR